MDTRSEFAKGFEAGAEQREAEIIRPEARRSDAFCVGYLAATLGGETPAEAWDSRAHWLAELRAQRASAGVTL